MKILGYGLVSILVILTIMAVAGFAIQSSPEGKRMISQRHGIERCRAMQNDELETFATRRAMRDICDGLTKRYRNEWNREP